MNKNQTIKQFEVGTHEDMTVSVVKCKWLNGYSVFKMQIELDGFPTLRQMDTFVTLNTAKREAARILSLVAGAA